VSNVIESPWAAHAIAGQALADAVNPAALAGLREVEKTFEECSVHAWPDGSGGVHVVIEDVHLGSTWVQDTTWLAFTINYLYPDADTYPHYVRADLARADGAAVAVPLHVGNSFLGQPAIMVSRSSPQRIAGLSTAARKALSVISFIQGPASAVGAP
jgi:hypothetical protein